MEAFAMMGVLGFALAISALTKVQKVERILRENHIRPAWVTALGPRLREKVGQTIFITLNEGEGDSTTRCKVLDVDEEWAHVLRNEGKWNQRELLIRLEDVKQIKD